MTGPHPLTVLPGGSAHRLRVPFRAPSGTTGMTPAPLASLPIERDVEVVAPERMTVSAVSGLIGGMFVAGLLMHTSIAATPATITTEAQAWWGKTGITVPSAVGHHIHVAATIPAPGTIVDGRVDVPVRLTLHGQVGTSSWIRWQDGPDTKGQIPIAMGPCDDCTRDMTLPVDFAKFGTGLRELRISLNVPDEQPALSGAQRMFQSFGLQVCVRACSPIDQGGRSLDFLEARGWYDDTPDSGAHGYQNARITSGIGSVRAGGTVTLKLAPGSGGRTTTFSGVYLDPDFHHGSAGRTLLTRNGSYAGTVTIPTDLTAGPHKFVALASDGKDAGVIAIVFQVGSGPTPTPTVAPTSAPTDCP